MAAKLLRESTEISDVELQEDESHIRVELIDPKANASIIASIIVNSGFELTALEREEMNLEDVFLQVTRGETQ